MTSRSQRAAALWAWLLLVAHLGGCASRGQCTEIARGADRATLEGLYNTHQVPLLLVGESVLLCSCTHAVARQIGGGGEARAIAGGNEARAIGGDSQARAIGGDSQARAIGGDSQARSIGGDSQARAIGGDSQARAIGGDSQARAIGGDSQARAIGGDSQARAIGGDSQARAIGGDSQARAIGGDSQARAIGGAAEVLTCIRDSACAGFRFEGRGPLRVFDGRNLESSPEGCVQANE